MAAFVALPKAYAQQSLVVTVCGTLPMGTTYSVGGVYPETQDTQGRKCTINSLATASRTATAQTSLIVTGQHQFMGATAVNSTGGFLMLWDAATEPADGVVSPSYCFPVPTPVTGGSGASMANTPAPVLVTLGIVVVFSTGADCFHKTSSPSWLGVVYQ